MTRLLLIALLALATPALAELSWDKPWQNFDRSPEDGHLDVSFAFQNTGSTPVTIKKVKTSCGCTTTRLDKTSYAPGERGTLSAKFNFGDRTGPHRKVVTATMDDGKTQELNFVVVIHRALVTAPALVFWKVGDLADAKSIQLTADTGTTVRVKGVTSSNPRVSATVETVKAGSQYTLAVKPVDTTKKESAELTIQTDFPTDAPRSYTVYARIK